MVRIEWFASNYSRWLVGWLVGLVWLVGWLLCFVGWFMLVYLLVDCCGLVEAIPCGDRRHGSHQQRMVRPETPG